MLGVMKMIAAFVLLLAVFVSAGESPARCCSRQTSMLPVSGFEGSNEVQLKHR